MATREARSPDILLLTRTQSSGRRSNKPQVSRSVLSFHKVGDHTNCSVVCSNPASGRGPPTKRRRLFSSSNLLLKPQAVTCLQSDQKRSARNYREPVFRFSSTWRPLHRLRGVLSSSHIVHVITGSGNIISLLRRIYFSLSIPPPTLPSSGFAVFLFLLETNPR